MKKLFIVFALMLMSFSVFAQSVDISGKIQDKDKQPLPGAAVYVKGSTNTATITDMDGKFNLKVPSNNSQIVISFVGMVSQTLSASALHKATITMKDEDHTLNEVVVTAMGIKKEQKALGYSVQAIGGAELMKNKQSNVVNSLNGKISGVTVTQAGGAPGAGSNIVIRGGTSLERDNQPLFVVDGIIYDNGTDAGGNSAFDGAQASNTTNSNRAMDINPEDIESMSVLKGASAAALYGSRAAAGVIIITTKRGAEGSVEINFSSKANVSWVNRYPEQQGTYKRGYYNILGTLDDYTTQSWGDKFQPGETMYNNIENFFQTATAYDNNISMSGGSKRGTFYLSVSNFTQSGIVPGTGYDKNTFRFNGDQKYGNLTVGANVSYTLSNLDKTLTSGGLVGSGGNGAMQSVYGYSRNDDMTHYLNDDGSRYRMFADKQDVADDVDNPYWIVNKDKLNDKTNRFTGALNLSYKVADWMNIMYKLGTDRYTTNSQTKIAPGSGVAVQYQRGLLTESDRSYAYLNSNLMLTFHKKISDFDLNLLLGQSTEDTKNVKNRRKAYNFEVPDFLSFGNATNDNKQFEQELANKRLVGVYGEFRAAYKNYLYLTFTGRNDWSSTLPVANRSYFYPSISGSFVFTELIPKNKILNFGKIRASWAEVGKDASPYLTNTTLWSPLEFLGGSGSTNFYQRGNPHLKPERTRSTELGLEMRMLAGRLSFDYAYYTSSSLNQIITPRTSNTTGYILMSTNAGDVYNKGMELSITGKPIVTDNFTWSATLNMSGNRGTVSNLLPGTSILYVTEAQYGNSYNTVKGASFENGHFMSITGNHWTRDDNNNVVLNWTTGMPVADNDMSHYVANREPKFIGGLNNSLQYKNWNLSFLFDFRDGGAVFNGTDYYMTGAGMSKKSGNRESLSISGVSLNPATNKMENKTVTFDANKFYKGTEEVDASVSGAESGKYLIQKYWQQNYVTETNNFITNTNWFRLRSLSLTYDFPTLVLKKLHLKALSATLAGNNLFLITNYKGMDPETSGSGSGVTGSGSIGMDNCGVPSTAGVSFGLNVKF